VGRELNQLCSETYQRIRQEQVPDRAARVRELEEPDRELDRRCGRDREHDYGMDR